WPGNASGVLACVLLARSRRSWRLGAQRSAGMRRGWWALGIAVAIALTAPALYRDLPHALHGDPNAIGNLASALGNFGMFWVALPLLMTALALRDGLLGWPLVHMTVS